MTRPNARAADRRESPLPDWLDDAAVAIGDPPELPSWLEEWTDGSGHLPELPTPVRPVVSPKALCAPLAPAGTTLERSEQVPTPTARSRKPDLGEPAGSRLAALRQFPRRARARGLPRAVGGLAVAASLAAAVAFAPPPHEDLPSADVVRAFGAVDRLTSGAPVLVVLDYAPDRASDFALVEQSVVRHAAARGATLISVSPRPELAGRLRSLGPWVQVSELPSPNVDPESLRRLGLRDRSTGAPLDPALRLAAGNRPLELLLVVGEQSEVARWLSNLRAGANPPAVALVAGEASNLTPLRASGQLVGTVRGERDLRAYGTLAGDGAPPMRSGALTAGPTLVAALALTLAIGRRLWPFGRS